MYQSLEAQFDTLVLGSDMENGRRGLASDSLGEAYNRFDAKIPHFKLILNYQITFKVATTSFRHLIKIDGNRCYSHPDTRGNCN